MLVVGAGASNEFGLPTGRGLLDKISTLVQLESDDRGSRPRFASRELQAEFETAGQNLSEFGRPNESYIKLMKEAIWICGVCRLAPSIDNLLHAHASNKLRVAAGKILIAHAILEAEKNSSLFRDDEEHFLQLFFNLKAISVRPEITTISPIRSWLAELFWGLVDQRNFDDFISSLRSITFVTFNYDRCIEHFITNAASLYFDLTTLDVEKVFSSISVIHPYGSLGALEIRGPKALGFGKTKEPIHIISNNINTFTEGGRSDALSTELNQAFSGASTVCFLGFGYLPLNMKLLFAEPYEIATILGTSLGLSKNSKGIVRQFLAEKVKYGKKNGESRTSILAGVDYGNESHLPELDLSDITCIEFMQRNRHLLS